MPLVPERQTRHVAQPRVPLHLLVALAHARLCTDMHEITLHTPAWLTAWMEVHCDSYPDASSRMRLAIELSALNIKHQAGGPFGAAVFDMNTHRLISAGVNRVVHCSASIAHAEIMAITLAQQHFDSFDLSASGLPHCELVTSCEPCAMCFGALPWSGIRHLICAACDADARAIGFDEGPKLPGWDGLLIQRGISVATGICRREAVDVLQRYAAENGLIYNACGGSHGD